ncbi:MAG: hypothetical protein PHX46_02660 [Bacilli bacterium]|nr:hypothetical protein [Bacilli bacterium]
MNKMIYGIIKKTSLNIKVYGCVCKGTSDEEQTNDGNNNDAGRYQH